MSPHDRFWDVANGTVEEIQQLMNILVCKVYVDSSCGILKQNKIALIWMLAMEIFSACKTLY